jgi:hypothetical protein
MPHLIEYLQAVRKNIEEKDEHHEPSSLLKDIKQRHMSRSSYGAEERWWPWHW